MICKKARRESRFLCPDSATRIMPQGYIFGDMNTYEVKIVEEDIFDAVYNITANAAAQRGDAAHVATEDNKGILQEFLEKGKALVSAALGRYGNGLEYSMPANWDFEDEINNRVNTFLIDYVLTSWMGLTAEVTMPVIELMSILNKRKKPL